MALKFRKWLELAWRLAKVESLLQRLHLVQRPKQRFLLRNVVLAGSMFAGAAVGAGVVCGRRSRSRGGSTANGTGGSADAPEEQTPATEHDRARAPSDADAPPDIGPCGPQ
jgi:hypothetical protein